MRKQRLLNDIQKILALNLSIAASFWGLNTQAFAHGGKADMVSLYQNMSEQGAKVVKDDFTNTYTITKGSIVVRAKPNSNQVLVNGKPEPYRVCRRVNILRDYPDDKTKLYPRN